jgi:quercetin dioxygenase-like cupin family protein
MRELVKRLVEHTGTRPEKFYKTTLFKSEALLLGINCLEPGQTQTPHEHDDQDKFYYVVGGEGLFRLGDEEVVATSGDVVWAPAGMTHGVTNRGDARLTLLVGIAPSP